MTKIKISEVLAMLKNGQNREAIGTHYGLNKTETKSLFQHPKLKGKRVTALKVPTFEIEDDIDVIADDTPGSGGAEIPTTNADAPVDINVDDKSAAGDPKIVQEETGKTKTTGSVWE